MKGYGDIPGRRVMEKIRTFSHALIVATTLLLDQIQHQQAPRDHQRHDEIAEHKQASQVSTSSRTQVRPSTRKIR